MLDNTKSTLATNDHRPDPAAPLYVNRVFSERVTNYSERDVVVDFKSGKTLRCRVPVNWSDNAAATLMSKYAVRSGVPDDCGGVDGREVDAERIFDRLVAGWRVAAILHGYWEADDPNLAVFCAEIKAMLEQQVAAPNSPQWFNTGVSATYGIASGRDGHYYATVDEDGKATAWSCFDSLSHPQISACFIQSVEDRLVGDGGIMDLWEREARLFKYGSGSGANYSRLRGKGEPLSRGGESSGLLSFLRVGDRSAGAVKSGGTTRRSARMVIVDVDHPDVEEFIAWKPHEDAKIRALHAAGIGDPASFEDDATDTVSGQNANNSVAVTDTFMDAVIRDRPWNLTARVGGHVTKTVQARDLWEQIAGAAWQCADPGLQFTDTINAWHTCKADGPIRGSNPCSEYVFLDDTACNLASLNLAKFYRHAHPLGESRFEWSDYIHAVRLWTIVLDVSVSMAGYPTAEIARRSMLYRTLGLGYAALGELLVLMGLGYGTTAGRAFAAELTSVLTAVAYRTSVELARKLGSFPRFAANRDHVLAVIEKHGLEALGSTRSLWLGVMHDATKYGVRNAQVSLLAPTGTIGIVMDCETTGVEPYYSDTTYKTLAGGGSMRLASRRFAEVLRANGCDPEGFTRREWTVEGGHVREYVWVEPPEKLADVLVCADALTPEQHVGMMAAVQPFLSGAISKTVNAPTDTTREQIADLYRYAWEQGLKSIAIYRDGCKPAQPLQGRKPPKDVQTFPDRAAAEAFLNASEQIGSPAATLRKLVNIKPMSASDKAGFTVPGPVAAYEAVARAIEQQGLAGARPMSENKTLADAIEQRAVAASVQVLARGERLNPPSPATSIKYRVELSGHTFYLICGEHDDGTLAEVFVTCSRTGSAMAGWVNAWAKTFSLALQHGTPIDTLVAAMRGEMFDPAGYHDGRPVLSPVDAFARIIGARYLADAHEPTTAAMAAVADGGSRAYESREAATEKPTGEACSECGAMALVRSGSCYVCRTCGTTTGCS